MDYKAALVNGIESDSKGDSDAVTSHIRSVPVTVQRKPFLQPEDDVKLSHTGTSSCDEDPIEAIQESTDMCT
jgi:peroxygenase